MEHEIEKKIKDLKEFIKQKTDQGTANYLGKELRELCGMVETEALRIHDVSGSLRFSESEVDFAYLCGVFNTSGIDGLHTEIQRLKELGKEPYDIIEACRKQ